MRGVKDNTGFYSNIGVDEEIREKVSVGDIVKYIDIENKKKVEIEAIVIGKYVNFCMLVPNRRYIDEKAKKSQRFCKLYRDLILD